ncbi:type I restriction endonuclease subunit R, EcoR124 family [Leuconostoc kimchii]|uniref:Type I restriction enzyme endonuclease subunit n=1 Tax=Leuconostoc kimchii TaxID=136609 RepID=A0ABX5SJG6_9LACO|nr:HsdR family type I site-specific deoxyribonuclease [Leuconostoc kimchii]QBR47178.1 type I restriction endonuclease subunit R [Leuconostoc kimchii]
MSLYKTKGEVPFERKFVENLTQHGWTYNSKLEQATPEMLENHFRAILNQNNQDVLNTQDLTDSEFGEVLRFITAQSPVEFNGFLTNGYESVITISRSNPEQGKIDLKVFWRDDVAGGKMRYEVIKQAIRPGKENEANDPNRRFDVTLLFNGLPLIQIEEKKIDVALKTAANQITKYKTENKYDGLYAAVQLFVVMKEDSARYFANQKNATMFNDKFFFEWLDKNNNAIRNWQQFAETFLMIPMAHNIISNYMVVDGNVLKVLRPYQIHAVKAVRDAAEEHKDGYVWHATGSGKTLTAYKVATLLQRDPHNQVIFLSDRTELDNQSGKNFSEFSTNSDDNIFETQRTNDLIKVLKSNNTGVITTTINKMKIAVERHNKALADDKRGPLDKVMTKRMIFIVDEAHRSQFGEMQRVIRQAFPNQNWYGFTGTPIFEFNKTAQDQTTQSQFGDKLHTYNIGNALKDGAILKFNSEYIANMSVVPSNGREEDITSDKYEGDSDDAKAYRQRVAQWMIKNWDKKSVNRQFNAILAVNNIKQAVDFYDLFQEMKQAGEHDLKIALTYSISDNGDDNLSQRAGLVNAMRDYSLAYTNNETTFNIDNSQTYIDDVAKRTSRMDEQYKYLDAEDTIDLTIVVARLLTGFDAQRLNTLYLDKLMQYQGLIQAYARTNRIYDKHKIEGNIVVFRRPELMKERTQDAFEKYAGEGSFKKVFRPEFKQMQKDFKETVENLKRYVPSAEVANNLQDESQADQIEFLNRFRELARSLQYIASYSEFNWQEQVADYGITDEEYGYYQGAFENIKARMTQPAEKDEPEGEQLTFDFDDVVITELLIDRDYVLNLATKYLRQQNEFTKKQDEKTRQDTTRAQLELEDSLDKLSKSGHEVQANQIKTMVSELQHIELDDEFDAVAAFATRQHRAKRREILDFADEYGLDDQLLTNLVTGYESNGEFTHENEIKQSADIQTAINNGHQYKNQLGYKGDIQRAWRTFISEDLAKYRDTK